MSDGPNYSNDDLYWMLERLEARVTELEGRLEYASIEKMQ